MNTSTKALTKINRAAVPSVVPDGFYSRNLSLQQSVASVLRPIGRIHFDDPSNTQPTPAPSAAIPFIA